jgi:hypothetical protein
LWAVVTLTWAYVAAGINHAATSAKLRKYDSSLDEKNRTVVTDNPCAR